MEKAGAELATWARAQVEGRGPAVRVPPVEQTTNYTCGPACLKAALGAFGIGAEEDDLASQAGTSADGGTSVEGLAEAARLNGVEPDVQQGATTDDLVAWLSEGKVPICCIQAWAPSAEGEYAEFWGNSHWIVPCAVREVDGERWFDCMDPTVEDGMRATLSEADLDERWHGHDQGERVNGLVLVLSGDAPAQAHLALAKTPLL